VLAAKTYWARGGKADGQSCVEQIAHVYGKQAVVISVDPRRVWVASTAKAGAHAPACVESPQDAEGPNGERFCWYECTIKGGREGSDLDVIELARGCEALGAGELLLNSIDADGQNRGFDLALISQVKKAVSIPVIASSGAGSAEHFSKVFEETGVEVSAQPAPARARSPRAHARVQRTRLIYTCSAVAWRLALKGPPALCASALSSPSARARRATVRSPSRVPAISAALPAPPRRRSQLASSIGKR
jgi:hypothetical protein